MPAVFGVHFREGRLPSHARWQGAIYAAGFRVALMPTAVAEHEGQLPVKSGGVAYDSGFQFSVDRWERDEPFLAGLILFAHFRCNRHEWPVAVCAAAGFAKASGGIFNDPYGNFIPDIGEVIAYAHRESREPG